MARFCQDRQRLETVADVFGIEVEPMIVHSDGTRPVIHMRDDVPNAQTRRAGWHSRRIGFTSKIDSQTWKCSPAWTPMC